MGDGGQWMFQSSLMFDRTRTRTLNCTSSPAWSRTVLLVVKVMRGVIRQGGEAQDCDRGRSSRGCMCEAWQPPDLSTSGTCWQARRHSSTAHAPRSTMWSPPPCCWPCCSLLTPGLVSSTVMAGLLCGCSLVRSGWPCARGKGMGGELIRMVAGERTAVDAGKASTRANGQGTSSVVCRACTMRSCALADARSR